MKIYVEQPKKAKLEYAFIPASEVEIEDGKTLGEKIADLEAKNKALQKEVNILTNAFKTIIESIVGIKNETN